MKTFSQFLNENKLKLTLQYHQKLNPAIWRNETLKPDLKLQFLLYAKQFILFVGIPKEEVKDIIFTGSNVNRNYTKYSDCDIHIITDTSKFPPDYLYNKKLEWESKHKRLKVAGYPVEFFAQDYKEQLPSDQGQYSILNGKWIARPPAQLTHTEILQDPLFLKKVSYYIHVINRLLVTKDVAGIKDLKEKFYNMRSAGLQKAGEFSYENSLYKELRNRGFVSRLDALLKKTGL